MKKSLATLWVLLCFSAFGLAAPEKPEVPRKVAQPYEGDLNLFEEPGRDRLLRLPVVFEAMKLKKGSRVADVGAGGGWLSVRLAQVVGPTGRVYANDILPGYVAHMKRRAQNANLPQMVPILGDLDDPKLPADLDAVIILNAYHEFGQPISMLRKISASMKRGARLAFIERDTGALREEAEDAFRRTGKIVRRIEEVPDGNRFTDDHRLAANVVRREAQSVGFHFVQLRELGKDNYLLVMEKR